MNRNLFVKIFVSFLLISFLSFTLSSFITAYFFKGNLLQFTMQGSQRMQEDMVSRLTYAYEKQWDEQTKLQALQWGNEMPEHRFQLYDGAGKFLYAVGNLQQNVTISPKLLKRALAGKTVTTTIEKSDQMIVAIITPIQSTVAMKEQVIVSLSYTFERDLWRFRQPFIPGILISLPISGFFIYLLSRRFAKPLKQMSTIAKQYATGNFSEKVQYDSSDEIGQLATSLNFMAHELEQLEQARTDFIANISHDLRSPLTSMNGFLTAFRDGKVPPDKQMAYIQVMKEASDRMMALVEQLLQLAKIQAGAVELHKQPLNLTEKIRQTIARLEPVYLKKQLAIEFFASPDMINVVADGDRLDQVITNLVHNAIVYCPDGATIRVRLTATDCVTLVVEDEGIGIAPEDLPRIWERFYKSDAARTQKVGTGIGLAIVKQLVELHGGTITVQSELHKGSIFTVTLPLT